MDALILYYYDLKSFIHGSVILIRNSKFPEIRNHD